MIKWVGDFAFYLNSQHRCVHTYVQIPCIAYLFRGKYDAQVDRDYIIPQFTQDKGLLYERKQQLSNYMDLCGDKPPRCVN